MSTTHRSDGPLLAGYHHSGDRGLGLLAESFPGTGEHGPSLPFPGLVFPADTGKEIICRIVTVPPLLTLFQVDELGRVTAEGPDGVHTGQAEGFADGASYGLYPIYVLINAGTLSGGVTSDAAVASGVLSPAPLAQLSGGVTAEDATAAGELVGVIIKASSRRVGSNLSTGRRLRTMALKLIRPPTALAVNLTDAKLDLRVQSGSAEDALITRLIRTATAMAEHETGRALMEQEWELILDEFPPFEIELTKPPQMSITSVKYFDAAGVQQTLPADVYTLDADLLPGWLFPAEGTSWPATRAIANAVRVRFKSGYGTTAADLLSLAPGLHDWVQVQVATLYEHRDLVALTKADAGQDTYGARLLDPYRTYL